MGRLQNNHKAKPGFPPAEVTQNPASPLPSWPPGLRALFIIRQPGN